MLGMVQCEGRSGRYERRPRRREMRDGAAAVVLDAVASACGVTRAELLSGRRCSQEVAASRQLAMYLVHVLLGRTYEQVGGIFGRDRTTVSYACARVEDRRDDHSPFELQVARLEEMLGARLAGEVDRAAS
jgi:chromosomal replication initiation ATPase DnaA